MRKAMCVLLIFALLCTAGAAALAEEYISARTPLNGSSGSKFRNISLAVNTLNGVQLPYGSSFSFNGRVGPRTEQNGYETAANGRGVKVLGGGVAQVATTLYLALKDIGGVEFEELVTYGDDFVDTYVENGSHAVITDYDIGIDLSFQNHADDMYIEMWNTQDWVYCSIRLGDVRAGNSAKTRYAGGSRRGNLIATACIELSGDAGLLNNVQLAADTVTDTVLYPGEEFSFNNIVGPRTDEYGYADAVNGAGDIVTGGGVDQVGSVIWLAIKELNSIEVLERHTYGERYDQTYVKRSDDAVLLDYETDTDISFCYRGGADSVTVYTYTGFDGEFLFCDIYEN